MKARARGEGGIGQLLDLCIAGKCLNGAAGYTEITLISQKYV